MLTPWPISGMNNDDKPKVEITDDDFVEGDPDISGFCHETVFTREKDGKQNVKFFVKFADDFTEGYDAVSDLIREAGIRPKMHSETVFDEGILFEALHLELMMEKAADARALIHDLSGVTDGTGEYVVKYEIIEDTSAEDEDDDDDL